MNFTDDMISKLSPDEQMILRGFYIKTTEDRPTQIAPEWPWTLKGPATPLQALRSRKGVPSPLLKGGKAPVEGYSLSALTS
jgi:hypothetical protein